MRCSFRLGRILRTQSDQILVVESRSDDVGARLRSCSSFGVVSSTYRLLFENCLRYDLVRDEHGPFGGDSPTARVKLPRGLTRAARGCARTSATAPPAAAAACLPGASGKLPPIGLWCLRSTCAQPRAHVWRGHGAAVSESSARTLPYPAKHCVAHMPAATCLTVWLRGRYLMKSCSIF